MRRVILGISLFFCAQAAVAVDGVFEINQLCVNIGCFDGDAPGFPVTLPINASYRLTGSLTVTGTNTTAISATADLVTVDLNGFTIIGPVFCGGSPVTSCSATSGTGVGVRLNASGNISNSTVKNGLIQGMGASGVSCTNCRIINVSARSNRQYGFRTLGGIITNSSGISNGLDGFRSNGIIESSFAQDNGQNGFFFFDGLLRGSRAINNGSDGIQCTNNCTALDNLSINNGGFGIRFFGFPDENRSSYGRNTFYGNGIESVSGAALQLDNNRCESIFCG